MLSLSRPWLNISQGRRESCDSFCQRIFLNAYEALPLAVQKLADKQYELLKENPQYPSLHLKKVGRYWSVRVGIYYRALAIEVDEGLLWFWIGSHADYDRLILKS